MASWRGSESRANAAARSDADHGRGVWGGGVMRSQNHLRSAMLARQIAAATRAGVAVLPGMAAESDGLAADLDAVADAIERRCAAGEPAEAVVAQEARRLPPACGAVLATEASGGDGHAALVALQDAAECRAASAWRWWLDVAYPLVVCALAMAGLVSLTRWYGPLIASVDDTMSGPRAGAIFDSRPVVEAVRLPALAVAAGIAALTLGWMLVRGRRAVVDPAPRARFGRAAAAVLAAEDAGAGQGLGDAIVTAISGQPLPAGVAAGALVAHAAAIGDPALRRAALATVARHERMVAVARGQTQGRLPAVIGSVVAGLAVLLYGVALFKPLVTLMQRVAEQPAVEQWRTGP